MKKTYTYETLTTSQDNVERSMERIKKNGEIFTPSVIIEQMMDMVSDKTIWSSPDKTCLDPTMGSGNIILAMMCRRLNNGVSPEDVVKTTYGVELMPDNVELCKQRVRELLGSKEEPCHDYDEILDRNLVCSDFFLWNFDQWRPKTEEELEQEKLLEKKRKKEQAAKRKAAKEAEKTQPRALF